MPSEKIHLDADDGYRLRGRVVGAGHRGPVVLINPATGVRQQYYGRFSAWLATQGATVVGYDYRGIGESAPARLAGFSATMHDWGRHDFEGVLRWARQQWPQRPLVAVGHSVGGQLLGQAHSNGFLSAAVTVASQFGSWHLWPSPRKWLMAGLWYGVVPGVTKALGYLPGVLGVGADLPKGVALEWARWNRSRRYFLDHGISAEGYAALTIPILSLSFSDDTYAPSAAVDQLHSLYTGAQVERRHLCPVDGGGAPIGHFGFFKDHFKDSLWNQVGAFIFGTGRGPVAKHQPLRAAQQC